MSESSGNEVDSFKWWGNASFLCYSETVDNVEDSWCGHRDNCTGLLLPFLFEETW